MSIFLINPGDLFDKMTILIIKLEKVKDLKSKFIITEELFKLLTYINNSIKLDNLISYGNGKLKDCIDDLFYLNKYQWELEDKVRTEESWEAAQYARNNNIQRIKVKNQINKLFCFPCEVKEYKEKKNDSNT